MRQEAALVPVIDSTQTLPAGGGVGSTHIGKTGCRFLVGRNHCRNGKIFTHPGTILCSAAVMTVVMKAGAPATGIRGNTDDSDKTTIPGSTTDIAERRVDL